MRKLVILIIFIVLSGLNAFSKDAPSGDRPNQTLTDHCVIILRKAMVSGEYSWMNVHAAEALIENGSRDGVRERFEALKKDPKSNPIGIYRVFARLNRKNPAKFASYVNRIRDIFLQSDSTKQRITALESLGKLGYSQPLPEIRKLAVEGKGALKVFSRWVLANSGEPGAQARLAALLKSRDPTDYFYTAYALRFFKQITPESVAALKACATRLAPAAPHRAYVLSALFVHVTAKERPAIRGQLLKYVQGEKSERFELAQALAIRGSASDLPVLKKLLSDPEMDVCVSAAQAILRIEHRLEQANRGGKKL